MSNKLKISYSDGIVCTSEDGCYIKTLVPGSHDQQFTQPNNYYLLMDGTIDINYVTNNSIQSVTSPYNSGWSNYIDHWTYSEPVKVKLYRETKFVHVKSLNSANDAVELNVKLGKVNNETITTSIDGSGVLMFYGNNIVYSVGEDSNKTDKVYRFQLTSPQTLTFNSTSESFCLLIQEV